MQDVEFVSILVDSAYFMVSSLLTNKTICIGRVVLDGVLSEATITAMVSSES